MWNFVLLKVMKTLGTQNVPSQPTRLKKITLACYTCLYLHHKEPTSTVTKIQTKKHKCIDVYWINVLHWQVLLYIININYSAFFPLGYRYFICNILRDFFIDLENLWISKFWLCRCSFLESFFCIIMRNIYWYLSIIHLFIPHLDFQVFTWKIFFSFWQNHIHSDKHSSLLETSPLHSYEGSFVELV